MTEVPRTSVEYPIKRASNAGRSRTCFSCGFSEFNVYGVWFTASQHFCVPRNILVVWKGDR